MEAFDVKVTLPDWETEPDEEAWYEAPNEMMVDPDGNPLHTADPGAPPFEDPTVSRGDDGEKMDQQWLDRAIGRNRAPGAREPSPRQSEPAEPMQ